jgi:methylglyoxal synthase
MRVCDVHQVPLATNHATAEAIVSWLTAAARAERTCRLA